MASRRGVLVVVIAAALLGTALFLVALQLRGPARSTGEPSVLVYELPLTLEEGEPPARPFPFASARRGRTTLFDVISGLDRAADDDRVEALVLHVGTLDWGWAKVGEVRDAVLRFRESGKPVYASFEGGGEREYLLASAADWVSMPPTQTLQLDGLSVTATFFRGTFDKLDVVPNFAHVGRYKSGVETYTRTGLTPESRESLDAVLDDLYGLLADSVASARGMTADSVRSLLDRGPFLADDAIAMGLLDTLLYDTEVDSFAVGSGDRRLAVHNFQHYLDRPTSRTGPRIALVTASGSIVPGKSRDLPGEGAVLGAETLVDALREARTRRSVKAIVLRIDSPGGVAQAADDMWREVERCRAAKPVIVSMSDYAASGGYYVAVAADSIVASPATLTGSIGIYGGKLNVLGLYHKLGLNVEILSRGRNAQMLSPYRDFSAEEGRAYQASLENFYRGFVARVANGRRLDPAEVDSIAQGRVWTGLAGRRLKLVDRLGGIAEALAMAQARAGIDEDEEVAVERFPKVQRSFFERVFEQLVDEDDVRATVLPLSDSPILRAWLAAARFPAGVALAVVPFSIDIR